MRKSSSCFFSFFSSIHWLFCLSAVTSKAKPKSHKAIPASVPGVKYGIEAKAVGGMEFRAVTGSMTRETQVA